MDWWQAVILGLVEGITEYLPVSSTGHLIIASELLGLTEDPTIKRAVDSYNIVIQGGAILAVLGLYWPRVWQMIRGLLGKDPAGLSLWLKLVVAFLPAAVLGVLLDEMIERHLFRPGPVIAALALGAVWMIVLDYTKIRPQRRRERAAREGGADGPSNETAPREWGPELHEISYRQALLIGLLQCVAMWPGTSRSMMTIAGGVLVGLSPKRAAEFSFLLGLPTLGGACVYKLYQNVTADEPNIFEVFDLAPLLIGIAVATVSAALAVRWLVGFLNRHGLAVFGYYRLVLAAVLGGLIAAGVVSIGPAAEERMPVEPGILPEQP